MRWPFADVATSAAEAGSKPKGKKKKSKKKSESQGFDLGGIEPAPPPEETPTTTAQDDTVLESPASAPVSPAPSDPTPTLPPGPPPEEQPAPAKGQAEDDAALGGEEDEELPEEEESSSDDENYYNEDIFRGRGRYRRNPRLPKLSKEELKRVKELRRLSDILIQLTPHEREQVYVWDWEGGLASKLVKVKGKKVELAKALEGRWEDVREIGTIDPALDTEDPATRFRRLPPALLRPHAQKMELPLERHLKLGLDLLGRGNVFQPPSKFLLWKKRPVRDYAFGMYGNREAVAQVLGPKWARKDPKQVLNDQNFYQDILDLGHQFELTLMAVATRPLPFEIMKAAFFTRLALSMAAQPEPSERDKLYELYRSPGSIPEGDVKEARRLWEAFDVEALKDAGLVDDKGQLKQDTTLIFTTLPDRALGVEAIQPGIIRDRKGVWLGHFRSPRLTRAIFDLHLGPYPLNGLSKAMVGNDTLYAANGFTFDAQTAVANTYLDGKDGPNFGESYIGEEMLPVVEAFHFYNPERTPYAGHLLLGNISRILRARAKKAPPKKRFLFF